MNYIEKQKLKAISIRDRIFKDPGYGTFFGKQREFVLSDPALNLWEGIREDALDYFKENSIPWWSGNAEPTGHLLSSQIACVNHLFPLRQRKDCVDAILNNLGIDFSSSVYVDSGYLEFEKTGKIPLGKEKSIQRGANSTSIDALMVSETKSNKKILVLIEWKYTEFYSGNFMRISEKGKDRFDVYKELLLDNGSPIICNNFDDLFYEPYYQLMRQTLLCWTMTSRAEYGVTDWIHVHVIPKGNKELRDKITSPNLAGITLEDSWRKMLKQPEKYIVISPEELMLPLIYQHDTKSIIQYLKLRYWD